MISRLRRLEQLKKYKPISIKVLIEDNGRLHDFSGLELETNEAEKQFDKVITLKRASTLFE